MARFDPLALNAEGAFRPGNPVYAVQFERVPYYGAPSLDPDTASLVAAMTSPPDAARVAAIDALINTLRNDEVWPSLDALYVTAAHHEQASRLNWKSPGDYTLLAANSPTFEVDRGWTGDTGSVGRLRTQFTASVDAAQYTLNDASAWLWWTAGAPASVSDFGDNTAPRTAIQANSSSTTAAGVINTSNFSSFANGGAAPGFVGMQRTTSTHQRLFKDGVQVGSDAAQASTSVPSNEWWVCGNAAAASSRQIAAVAWGASLAGKEAAFYAALQTYMQAVGAA